MPTTDKNVIHVPRRFVAEEWGGTETVILEIARQQQKQGWQPRILTSMALARLRSEEIAAIPVQRFPYCYPFLGLSQEDRLRMDKKGGNLVSFSLLWALLRTPHVRLFHAHTLKRVGGAVRTAARWRKKPYVVSLHGGVFDVPKSEMDILCEPARTKLEWGRPLGLLLGSHRVLEEADHVICVGASETEKARQSLGHDRISYLPNGVDTEKFKAGDREGFRQRHGIPSEAFLWLNISRIDAQKNQKLLLEGFARFNQHYPGSHLVLIGPETQRDYADTLRQVIREQHMEKVVRFLPGMRHDNPDLVNAYHACDVFCLTSVHEPFGIVVLEAWSSGRPVLTSNAGGLGRLVETEKTGLCIDPFATDAPVQVERAMERLYKDEAFRRSLADNGHREALSHYGWDRIQEQLEGIYQAAEKHASGKYS